MTLEEKRALLQSLKEESSSLDSPKMTTAYGTPNLRDQPIVEEEGIGSKMWEGAKDVGRSALGKVAEAGQFIDKYTGAPTRAAIGSLQENMLDPGAAASAAYKQFGEDPSLAPTGKDIAAKAGLSREPMFDLPWVGGISPAGVAGFGVDVAADPLNVIPLGAAAKLAGKTGGKAAKVAAKAIAKSVPMGAKATDVITGTKGATKLVKTAEGLALEAADAIKSRFSSKRAIDYDDMIAIAEKNGIDPKVLPDAIEFGKESFVTRAGRKQAEGVLGEPLLRKHEAATQQVNQALGKKINSMSSTVMSPPEAGKFIRDAYDDAVEEVFNQIDITYSTAGQQLPGLNIKQFNPEAYKNLENSLSAVKKEAQKMIDFGVTSGRKTQGKQLMNAIDQIKASGGDYNVLASQLREIGEAAFKSKNVLADIPPDIKNLRKVYFDTQDSLIETTRAAMGDEIADQLILNNKYVHDFLTDKSVVSKAIGSKTLPDERVFTQLVSNGDTKKLEALNNILGPERMKELKGSFVNELVKQNIEGKAGFRSTFNSLRNKQNIADKILDPQDIVDLQEILTLGDRMGIPVMSTSGTGASQSFGSVVKEIPEAMMNKRIIEKLKNQTRGVPTPTPTTPAPQIGVARKSPVGMGAKAAQVYSVQKQSQRRDKERELKKLIEQYNSLRK